MATQTDELLNSITRHLHAIILMSTVNIAMSAAILAKLFC
jgi:hypothetical protein